MGLDIVQVSNSKTIDANEEWTTLSNVMDVQYKARLGEPRKLVINYVPTNERNINYFSAYQRIRVLERNSYTPFFLGRIEKLNPKFSKGIIEIICGDYMSDLSKRTNSIQSINKTRRSDIIKDIINEGIYVSKTEDTMGALVPINYTRSVQTFQVEDSPFLGRVIRAYGNDTNGFESILDSIRKLGMEESWQDLQAVMLRDGNYEFVTPLIWSGGGVLKKPENGDTLYLGSKKKFSELYFNNNKAYIGTEPTVTFSYSDSDNSFDFTDFS